MTNNILTFTTLLLCIYTSTVFSDKYYGIPYAQPPINELRFRPPVRITTFAGKEFYNATTRTPPCKQLISSNSFGGPNSDPFFKFDESSEDCLYLHVYTPNGTQAGENLPVMVFIQGGANRVGQAATGLYDLENFANYANVVGVAMEYRVNIFGFFAHEQLLDEDGTTGNYGMQDQRAALMWVRDHIYKFGGNKNRITLIGNSAGGLAVCHHLTSPQSENLFRYAWSISGPCWAYTLDYVLDINAAYVEQFGCANATDQVDCLRQLSADTLVTVNTAAIRTLQGLEWAPAIDGFELIEHPIAKIESGRVKRKPFVNGLVENEGIFLACRIPSSVLTTEFYTNLMNTHYTSEFAPDVLSLYSVDEFGTAQEAYNNLVNETTFWCRVHRGLRGFGDWTTHSGIPPLERCFGPFDPKCKVWHYNFNYNWPVNLDLGFVPPPDDCINGAFHFLDIPFLFRNHPVSNPFNETESDLMEVMSKYLKNFVHCGNPNGIGLPNWRAYSSLASQTQIFSKKMVFTNTSPVQYSLRNAPQPERCQFWDALHQTYDELPGLFPEGFN